jgi:hypothetical protein
MIVRQALGSCALISHATLRERGSGEYPPPPDRSLPFAFAVIFQSRTRRALLNGTPLERLFPNPEWKPGFPRTGRSPWGGSRGSQGQVVVLGVEEKSHLAGSSQGHENSGSALIYGDQTGSGGRILRKGYRDFAVESSVISAGFSVNDAEPLCCYPLPQRPTPRC